MMSCGPSQASGNVIIFITYVQHLQAAVCTVRCLRGETDTAIWPLLLPGLRAALDQKLRGGRAGLRMAQSHGPWTTLSA